MSSIIFIFEIHWGTILLYSSSSLVILPSCLTRILMHVSLAHVHLGTTERWVKILPGQRNGRKRVQTSTSDKRLRARFNQIRQKVSTRMTYLGDPQHHNHKISLVYICRTSNKRQPLTSTDLTPSLTFDKHVLTGGPK
ncbi:hypothetical protein CPC08DRAFT_294065 [Agrocybe pediades]|nr:hypothetical protein CPC08DRAFT_294065 [Agrocybe pediades]